MPKLLTRGQQTKRGPKASQVAGFISEWWPASNRNGGRNEIGIPGRLASEFAQQIGQLTISTFPNDAGLEALGGNLFRETAASGQPIAGVPGDPGFGVINQGYLEGSNVDPVKELVSLIAAQRAFELNSKVIQAVDEMAGTVSKGIR
jgi:flagellar basal body rod protein FlgG